MRIRRSLRGRRERTAAANAVLALAVTGILATPDTRAAVHEWKGSGGNWSNPANWVQNTTPTPASDLELRFTGPAGASFTANNDLASPFDLQFLSLNSYATTPNRITGGPLRFHGTDASPGGITVRFQSFPRNPAPFHIDNDLILAGETFLGNTFGTNPVSLNGVISGPGRLVAAGTSHVITNANTYTGGTLVFDKLNVTGIGTLGAGPVAVGDNLMLAGVSLPPQDLARLTLDSAANIASGDHSVTVHAPGTIGFRTLEAAAVRRISTNSVGTLTLLADQHAPLDLSSHPNLRIGTYTTDAFQTFTLSGPLTVSSDVYRFGGAYNPNFDRNGMLHVASRLSDAPGGAPRSVDIAATGAFHAAGRTKISNPDNGHTGGTFVSGERYAGRQGYLVFDYTPAFGATPLGTGPVTVAGGLIFESFSGGFGSLPNEIIFRPGSQLVFDNVHRVSESSKSTAHLNRWPDEKPIALNGTELILRAFGTTDFAEKVGHVSFDEASIIRLNNLSLSGTQPTTFHAESLTRSGRGTLLLYSEGAGSFGNQFRVRADDARALADPVTGMLPAYIVADSSATGFGNHTGFVTADASGLIARQATTSTPNPATDTEVLRSFGITISADETVHALEVDGIIVGAGNTLTIRSGGVAFIDEAVIDGPAGALAFVNDGKPVEALFYTRNNSRNQIKTPITVADGVTFFGHGFRTTLAAPNTFTGPLTVQSGTVELGHALALPADAPVHVQLPGALHLNGNSITTSSLTGGGTIHAGTASATLTVNATGDVEFSGRLIDTPTQNRILSLVKTGPGTLTLSGTNGLTGYDPIAQYVNPIGGYAGLTTVKEGTLNLRESFTRYDSYRTDAGAALNIYTDHDIVTLDGEGTTTIADGAIVTSNHVRQGSLRLESKSKLNIRPGQANPLHSEVAELTIAPDATLDLADSDLLVRADAGSRQQVLADVTDHIRSARNAPAGRWRGPGLTSSVAATNPLTGLAVGFADDGVLVKHTYNGDANLDGRINSDDYFRIDSGFLAQPANPRFANGDFNYDGKINSDEYFLIDSAFLGQGTPLSGSGDSSPLMSAAVPEPSAAILAFVGLLAATRRQRRR